MVERLTRVGVVADTHVPSSLSRLPASLRVLLAGVDQIIHAGDLTSLDVLNELADVAPTAAVVGNCDAPEVARRLPLRTTLSIAGRRIGIHHGHQRHAFQNQYIGRGYGAPEFDLFYRAMSTQLPGCDVIVFGHFHEPVVREWGGVLFVNPGSVAPPHARPTIATLEIGEVVTARVQLLS